MAEPKNKNKTMATEPSHCLLCGQLGPALSHGHWICEHCKIVVQADVPRTDVGPGMLADASPQTQRAMPRPDPFFPASDVKNQNVPVLSFRGIAQKPDQLPLRFWNL